MARLYEYVPSSEKSGFFLLGSNGGQNTTIQVRPLGDRVFEQLDYEAGRRGPSGSRGEKLPRELVNWLWNVRLLYTESGKDSTDKSLHSVLDLDDEAVALSETDIQQLVEFVETHDSGDDVDLMEELVEILGIDVIDRYDSNEGDEEAGSRAEREAEASGAAETEDGREPVENSPGVLTSDERAELEKHLSNAIDESEDTVSLENHLPRANNPRAWLKSVRHFLNDSDAFVHRAAIGSEGDPIYNMQTVDIQWDLYDLRESDRDDAAVLVVINPLSGHSPKQSFRVSEDGITDWQSYEEYLGIRQVRELISVVPSVWRTLRSIPAFDVSGPWTFPEPSSRAMWNARSMVNQSLMAAGEPFDVEPARSKVWAEVIDISPKGWVELRLQTNRAVVVAAEKFTETEPEVEAWVLLEPTGHTDWPTSFDVVTVG